MTSYLVSNQQQEKGQANIKYPKPFRSDAPSPIPKAFCYFSVSATENGKSHITLSTGKFMIETSRNLYSIIDYIKGKSAQ